MFEIHLKRLMERIVSTKISVATKRYKETLGVLLRATPTKEPSMWYNLYLTILKEKRVQQLLYSAF
jgi:hypothetical protein